MAVWKRSDTNGATATATKTVVDKGPQFLAPTTTLRTSLGEDSEVTGRLSFNAPTRIDGRLNGEVSCSDLLVIGETGTVDGNVRATELVVLGKIQGDIRGAQRVELGPRGRIDGTVETQELAVQDGGKLEAVCRVGPPRADVHVLAEHRSGEEVDD